MAIIVEQGEKPKNWWSILTAIVVVVLLFGGIYFIFFKKPQLIDLVAPSGLEKINELSEVAFDPNSVINSPIFKSLRQYGQEISLPSAGRSNPFQPF